MRRHGWLALIAAFALAGCDDDEVEMDGGPDEVDGGAPATELDAGAPAGERDAGDEDAGASDAGADLDDAGSPDGGDVECPSVEVQIGETCPAFTACGGELPEADYCQDGLCIERADLLAPMAPYCAGIVLEETRGTVTGRVSFRAGGRVERSSVTVLDVTALFPMSCVVNGCDEIGTLIETQVPRAAATCVMTDECRCGVTIHTAIEVAGAYTADATAGIVTIGSGDSEREYDYDYCVDSGGSGAVRLRRRSGAEHGVHSIAPEG